MAGEDKVVHQRVDWQRLRIESASERRHDSWKAALEFPIGRRPNFNYEPTMPPPGMQFRQNSI